MLHESLCLLHAHRPFFTSQSSLARAAASHECLSTAQKKNRSHLFVPQSSEAPLEHQASHSAEVATLGFGRIAVTPPWLLHVEAQNEASPPAEHVPCTQMVAVEKDSPSVQRH